MAKTNIGRVSVVPKGEYSSIENYKRLDVVSDNGSMYISKKDNNQGNPITDKNWWFKAVEKGEVGPQGEKPVNGVDYNTDEEKEEFKNDVVNKATEEVKKNISDTESEAIKKYNDNATQKTNEYNTNADTKLKAYNDNTTTKLKEYNDNANSKVSEYNTNASSQTETFNSNASTKTTKFDTNAASKTNDFNDNYEKKLSDINEASISIEAERKISDSKYAKALKTQVTDVENIQIYAENDVVDDLIIKGAPLTQEIREGYNKFYLPQTSFDIIGLNVNIKNSNELTIKGIPTSTYFIKDFIGDDFKTIIENGKTYTILAIPNFRTETTRLAYYITWYNSDSEVVYKTSPTIWLSNGKVIKVFTPEFDQEISYFRLTLEGMTKDVEYDFDLKFMMLEGEYAEDNMPEFELYGASPSLDYPSEIQVVDEQNIQIAKNNYLDTTQIANKTFSNGGLTVTTDGNGIFTVNGTHSEQVNIDFGNLDFKLRSGQKIKLININGINDTSNNLTDIIRVLFWDFYFNDVSQINMYVNIVRGGNVNRAGIRFLIPSDKTSVTYTNFKFGIMVVNADDNIQDYQPYYGTNITIPLVNSAIGQYTDTIDRENNVQNKVIQELILTGNEDFKNATYEPGEGFYAYYIKLNMLKLPNIKTFCNYFKQHNEAGDIQEECFTIPNTGNIVFIVQNYTTIEEFKTKLQELYELGKPVKVYYVAETSTPEPLSEEVKQELDKFKLYDGLNNISIDNGTLSFKYNKSLLKVLEEKDEKIDDLQSQIDEIKALLSSSSTASLLLENLANDNESEVS